MRKLRDIFHKHREQLLYLVFGLCTTVINYVCFWALDMALGDHLATVNNVVCFVVATAFAYVTNKAFVFLSRDWTPKVLAREVAAFVGSRLASFAIEELGLWVCVSILQTGRYRLFGVSGTVVGKVVLSLAAVIINYFFSKYFVFERKKRN